MDKLVYEWKLKSLAAGINPEDANAELNRIKNVFGAITAKTILQAATPEDSLFHRLFEWNDSIAAIKHRLTQARTLVNNLQVTIVRDEHKKISAPVFEITRNEHGVRSYKSCFEIATTPADLRYVKANAFKELQYWKRKYETYSELSDVVLNVEKALEHFESVADFG